MNSEQIKVMVGQVNAICSSDDFKFEQDRTKSLAYDLINSLLNDCVKSPQFAVAVYHHLKDAGYDLADVMSEFTELFNAVFSKTIERLDERSLIQIRKISTKLFA